MQKRLLKTRNFEKRLGFFEKTAYTARMMKNETLLTPALLDVISVLNNKAYLVGGAVRDFLNGQPIKDWDMATPLCPEQSIDLLTKAGYRILPTGLKHGTITILMPNRSSVELTTFRKDTETDGRHAQVSFTQDMKQDALRRDFTINALYMDRNGTVYDFFHGLTDLKKHRIRFIGAPVDRIQEDALRILRFFRFWGRFGGKKPPLTALKACQKTAFLLDRLSAERKRDELFQILTLPNAPHILHFMNRYGILRHVISPAADFKDLFHFMRLEKKQNSSFGVLPRLLLCLKTPEQIPELALSNAQKKELTALHRALHMDLSTYRLRRRAAYLLSPQTVATAFYIRQARQKQLLSRSMARELNRLTAPVFPVTAADLMQTGIPAGPLLGQKQKEAERIWIEMNFPDKKELVLKALKR